MFTPKKKVSETIHSQDPFVVFRDPDWIQTNDLLLSIPTTTFVASACSGIWGLDYNFTIAGVPRLVSTEPYRP